MSDDSPVDARAPGSDAWTLPDCPLPVAGGVVEALCWNAGEAARWISCVQAIANAPPLARIDPWTCPDGLSFDVN